VSLNQRLRSLAVEFGLPEADYGLMIGRCVLALLAYPDERVAVVTAPLPADVPGWDLFAADPADEASLRTAVADVAARLGCVETPVVFAPEEILEPTLTAEQQAAVAHPDGRPARVLAGAGTGKTRVIIARFRHLVENGVRPDRILALTFSRAAAAQMRSEIVRHLKAATTLWVSTFHSFCLKVLETEQDQAMRLLHEAEARTILAGLAGTKGRQVEEAHAFIGQAKDQLLTPDQVRAYATARGDERLQRLADLYDRFQAELARQQSAEFGDFIYKAVQLLESDPAVAARWQGRFDHILIDEFQDTNLAQFRVLQILMQPHGNLMVVGDDDQAIYRFRGATDRYMRRFPEYLPHTANYPVVENFRCPAPVLDVANRLITHNSPERVEKKLYTLTKVDGCPPVAHWEARAEREEAEAVAAEIDRRLKLKWQPSDFAILLRSVRRSGGEFARALRERGIPYRLIGETYPHPATAQTLALLRLTQGLNVADLLTVLAARVEPADLFGAVRAGRESLLAGNGPASFMGAFRDLAAFLAGAKGRPVDQLVYEAVKHLGHLRISLTPSTAELERLAAVRMLQEMAAGAGTLEGLLEASSETEGVQASGGADAVSIMTIHAAKGLQYRMLFVSGLVEGRFPVDVDAAPVYYLAESIRDWVDDPAAVRERTGAERLAQHIREERRLAYVALTRAESELVLTRALTYGGEPAQPSRFLAEMGAPAHISVSGRSGDVVGAARTYLVEAAIGWRRPDAQLVTAASAVLKAEAGALPLRRQADPAPFGATDSLSLSASAIEKYRDCPRAYYYSYVLGLPDEDNVYTSFGSALHAALEQFNKRRMTGGFPSWPELEGLWAEAMQPEPFACDGQYRQLRQRGHIFLKRYYDWRAADPREVVGTEGAFGFAYTDHQGRSHQIRGRYDLIERDRAGNEEIIDYKSGTRTSTGVNKRPTGKSEKDPARKLQMGLYYLARYGGEARPGARVAYIFLKHDEDKPPLTWRPEFEPGEQYISCEHTAETLGGIRSIINSVIDGILSNRFDRNPDEWRCSTCPYYDACEVSRRAYF